MDLFLDRGAHVIVDGQYGSTGKGALSAWLAYQAIDQGIDIPATLSNAGPNSGHTFYHGDEKHVLKQLPTFPVASSLLAPDRFYMAVLTAGAIINPDVLRAEANRYPQIEIFVHPSAAVITDEDIKAEHSGTVAAVAGTRSGTGAAVARKVLRDPNAVWGLEGHRKYGMPRNVRVAAHSPAIRWRDYPSMVEVSQGFSLGLNQRFYPKVTSRECTVSQALADAGLPPRALAHTFMSVRTFPIRVGNVDGHSSGDWYGDQTETTWEALGQTPELTTVTQRIRRVATFSKQQFDEALYANDPDFVFVNFLNYLSEPEQMNLLDSIRRRGNFGVIRGYGPKITDVKW